MFGSGLVVVTQNIIGTLVNSHLFDFTPGWSYVVGVGGAGGVVLANGRVVADGDVAAIKAAAGTGEAPLREAVAVLAARADA